VVALEVGAGGPAIGVRLTMTRYTETTDDIMTFAIPEILFEPRDSESVVIKVNGERAGAVWRGWDTQRRWVVAFDADIENGDHPREMTCQYDEPGLRSLVLARWPSIKPRRSPLRE